MHCWIFSITYESGYESTQWHKGSLEENWVNDRESGEMTKAENGSYNRGLKQVSGTNKENGSWAGI